MLVVLAAALLSAVPALPAAAAAHATQTVAGSVVHGDVVLDAGADHTLALAGGRVFAWGANASGQLGDGTTTARLLPIPVAIPGGPVRLIAAGDRFSLAATDTAVWAWGAGASGQLGIGSSPAVSSAPQQVPLTDTAAPVSIAAGGSFALVALADGTVWSWGANDHGQLGTAQAGAPSPSPVAVLTSGRPVSQVAAARTHALAIYDGHVLVWGSNSDGELGYPGYPDLGYPTDLEGIGGMTAQTVTRVAAGDGFSVAIADGTAYAWGRDDLGQRGDGGASSVGFPEPVSLPGTATDIDAGTSHAIVATSAGVYTWGEGTHGELGHCSATSSTVPVHVCDMGAAGDSVSAGGTHSTVVQDGIAYGVGSNTSGQLGLGNYGQHSHVTPVRGGPSAPSVTWDAVTGEAVASWANPSSGAPAGGYTVTATGGDGSTISATTTSTTATLAGLDPLVAYTVDVASTALLGIARVELPAFVPAALAVTPSATSVGIGGSVSISVEGFTSTGLSIGIVTRHCGCTTTDGRATVTPGGIAFGTAGDQTVTATIGGATGSATVLVTAPVTPPPSAAGGPPVAAPAGSAAPTRLAATGVEATGLGAVGALALAAGVLLLGAVRIHRITTARRTRGS